MRAFLLQRSSTQRKIAASVEEEEGRPVSLAPSIDLTNLMWRYDSANMPVLPDGTDIVSWPDAGPNGAHITWPGPGFVFVPPFPDYKVNIFGSLPAARQLFQPGVEQPCGGQAPFSGGPITGTDFTVYHIGNVPNQQDAPAGGSIGVLLDYPALLGVAPHDIVLPYVGGTGAIGAAASLTLGFAYNMASLATGTVLVDIAVRSPGRHVYAWAFSKATRVVSVYEDGVLLGASAADANLAGGFDFGMNDGTGKSSNIFSDFAGGDGILGDIGANWAFSDHHNAARVLASSQYFAAVYSL